MSLRESRRGSAKALYEELYCARGDMENRIKEQQLAVFSRVVVASRTLLSQVVSASWAGSGVLKSFCPAAINLLALRCHFGYWSLKTGEGEENFSCLCSCSRFPVWAWA